MSRESVENREVLNRLLDILENTERQGPPGEAVADAVAELRQSRTDESYEVARDVPLPSERS